MSSKTSRPSCGSRLEYIDVEECWRALGKSGCPRLGDRNRVWERSAARAKGVGLVERDLGDEFGPSWR